MTWGALMWGRRQFLPSFWVVVLLAAATVAFAPTAQAFELFGYHLWGEKKQDLTPEEAAEAVPYKPELTLTKENEELKESLEESSDLVSRADEPPAGVNALYARAVSDRKRLIAALYADGRYGGTVDIAINGMPIDDIVVGGEPPAASGDVPVKITVDPGPQFTFDDARIVSAGSDADISENPADYGIKQGEVAGSQTILTAGDKIALKWRQKGHALAKVDEREIVADHATNTVDVTYHLTPGPVAHYGAPTVEGEDRMDPDFILRYAAIEPGKRYDPEELAKAEKRLRELGAFDGVKIREGKELGPDGTLPLTIQVEERKRRYFGAGLTYSNTEGGAVELYWGHRNLFGGAERLRIEGKVGRLGDGNYDDLDYSTKVTFAKPGVLGPATEFTAEVFAIHEEPDAYVRTAAGAIVGVSYKFTDEITARIGAEVERSRIEDALGKNDYLLTGVPLGLTYDSRDNKLDPTKGFLAMLEMEPLYDAEGGNGMFLSDMSLSTYRSIDSSDRFILAGKVAVGSAFGAGLDDIPADRRFYLGGGGTIRGYGYQNVGPHRGNGKIIGGLSYFLASAEVRTRLTDTIGAVAFVDTGNAFRTRYPDFSEPLRTGIGAGIRYLTPIGPLRLDAAIPLDKQDGDPDFGIYVGIGQSF